MTLSARRGGCGVSIRAGNSSVCCSPKHQCNVAVGLELVETRLVLPGRAVRACWKRGHPPHRSLMLTPAQDGPQRRRNGCDHKGGSKVSGCNRLRADPRICGPLGRLQRVTTTAGGPLGTRQPARGVYLALVGLYSAWGGVSGSLCVVGNQGLPVTAHPGQILSPRDVFPQNMACV